jgi:hypothetical protein
VSGSFSESIDQEARKSRNVALVEPERRDAALAFPCAEDDQTLVTVPGDAEAVASFVGEVVPTREPLNSTHAQSVYRAAGIVERHSGVQPWRIVARTIKPMTR